MIQSVWKNLTGLQKAAEHLWCDFKWLINKHQWLVHPLYGQKYWHQCMKCLYPYIQVIGVWWWILFGCQYFWQYSVFPTEQKTEITDWASENTRVIIILAEFSAWQEILTSIKTHVKQTVHSRTWLEELTPQLSPFHRSGQGAGVGTHRRGGFRDSGGPTYLKWYPLLFVTGLPERTLWCSRRLTSWVQWHWWLWAQIRGGLLHPVAEAALCVTERREWDAAKRTH